MPTSYEILRMENIARNKKLLVGLMKKNAAENAHMPTSYEILRMENIARNKKLLEDLMKKHAAEDARRPQPKETRMVGRKSAPELKRLENMARNKKLLEGLIEKFAAEDACGPQPNRTMTVGRESSPEKLKKCMQRTDEDEIEGSRPMKRARPETSRSGLRLRNAGKATPDCQAESQAQLPHLVTTGLA